jgi:hypothetical protein
MLETQQNPPKEIPSYLKVFGVLLVIVLAYLGWVFYGRWTSNQQYRDKAAQQKADQAARDRYAVDKMGGDRFEILQFYAYPPSIHFGDDTSLCYGVSGHSPAPKQRGLASVQQVRDGRAAQNDHLHADGHRCRRAEQDIDGDGRGAVKATCKPPLFKSAEKRQNRG